MEKYCGKLTILARLSRHLENHPTTMQRDHSAYTTCFHRVIFQKCGSLFLQKDDFLIVFYTDINIQNLQVNRSNRSCKVQKDTLVRHFLPNV